MNELRQLIREAIIETLLAEKMPRGSAMRQPSTPGGRAARLGSTGVYHAQLGLPAKRGAGDTEEPDDVNIEPAAEPAKHVSRPIRPVVGQPNYKAYIAQRGKGPMPTHTQADVDAYDKQYPPEKPSKPMDEISPELARRYLYAPGGGSHRYMQAMKTAKRMSAAHGPTSQAAKATDADAQRQGDLYHHAKDTAHRDEQSDAVGEKVDFMKEISPELAARYLYAPGGGSHRYIAAMKAARKARQYGPEAEKAAQAAAEKAGGHYHHAMAAKNKFLPKQDKPIDFKPEGCH